MLAQVFVQMKGKEHTGHILCL